MFDCVHINLARLPVSTQDQERLQDGDFQTKSAGRHLDNLYITDNGYLECLANDRGYYNGELIEKPRNRVRFSDAYGTLSFYTSAKDGEWFEFMATFTDGRLTDLKRVEPQQVSRDETIYWSNEVEV